MTTTKPTKPVLECDNKTIKFMCGQIAQQKQVLRCVRAVLPSALAEQVQHCLIREPKLVVYTNSAAWASQLRFQQQAMLDAIVPLNMAVTQVHIKVLTEPLGVIHEPTGQVSLPSLTTIANMRKDGLARPDDEVKQALLSLSATLERLKKNQDAGRGD
jgi:hypothetical protein